MVAGNETAGGGGSASGGVAAAAGAGDGGGVAPGSARKGQGEDQGQRAHVDDAEDHDVDEDAGDDKKKEKQEQDQEQEAERDNTGEGQETLGWEVGHCGYTHVAPQSAGGGTPSSFRADALDFFAVRISEIRGASLENDAAEDKDQGITGRDEESKASVDGSGADAQDESGHELTRPRRSHQTRRSLRPRHGASIVHRLWTGGSADATPRGSHPGRASSHRQERDALQVEREDIKVRVHYFLRPTQLPVSQAQSRGWHAQELIFAPELTSTLTLADVDETRCAIVSAASFHPDNSIVGIRAPDTYQCRWCYSPASDTLSAHVPDELHLRIMQQPGAKTHADEHSSRKRRGRGRPRSSRRTSSTRQKKAAAEVGFAMDSKDVLEKAWTAEEVLYFMRAHHGHLPCPAMILHGKPAMILSATNCEMLGAGPSDEDDNHGDEHGIEKARAVFGMTQQEDDTAADANATRRSRNSPLSTTTTPEARSDEADTQLRRLAARRAASSEIQGEAVSPTTKRSKTAIKAESAAADATSAPRTRRRGRPRKTAAASAQSPVGSSKQAPAAVGGSNRSSSTGDGGTPGQARRGRGRPRKYPRKDASQPPKPPPSRRQPLPDDDDDDDDAGNDARGGGAGGGVAHTSKPAANPLPPNLFGGKPHTPNAAASRGAASDSSAQAGDLGKNIFKRLPFAAGLDLDDYFAEHHASATKTSKNTLARLALAKMTEGDVWSFIRSFKDSFEEERAQAMSKLRQRFPDWVRHLRAGFNLLLYGTGSKKELVCEFANDYLKDAHVVTVNGYFPSLSVKQVLTTITTSVLNVTAAPRDPVDHAKAIQQFYHETAGLPHLYLLVHNLDGPRLRTSAAQDALSILASTPKVHIIATIDHVNSPLMWDYGTLGRFNFVWQEANTYANYDRETSYAETLVLKTSQLKVEAVQHVMSALPSNARKAYWLLLDYVAKNPGVKGVPFEEYLTMCTENFAARNELRLRAFLREFKDHNLVALVTVDGNEFVKIPADADTVKEVIATMEEHFPGDRP